MEIGFLLDNAHNVMSRGHWVAGEAEDYKLLGILPAGIKTSGKTVLAVDTWRCTSCGYLESYAETGKGRSGPKKEGTR